MLIGRGEEVAAVGRLLESARSGSSGVLVVRGEAGIGKTALLEHALRQAEGMTVLRAVGIESESELPFAALHQLLRPVLDRIDRLPAPQAAALRGAFALSQETVEERFRVSVGLLGLLSEAAEERPVLCVVDDAQWLDDASADALVFAARRLHAESLALLFAARDDERNPFVAPGLPELRLAALAAPDARALVVARLGPQVAPEVVEWLLESSNGNPLALVELPVGLTDEQIEGRSALAGSVAPVTSVEQAFLNRVATMSPAARHLLLVAAAEESGDQAVVARAAAALGLEADELASAEAAGLVRVDLGRIAFRHPLLRAAVYRSAGFAEREHAHRALAAALEGEADADRRAWHRAAATVGVDEEIAADLEASADRAIRRAGYAAAASGLEKAAALSPDDRARTSRLVAAADAAWLAGKTERARALLSEAARHAPPELQVDVTNLRGRIEVRCGVFADAMEMLISAAEALAASAPAVALRLLVDAEEATLYTGDTEAAVQIGRLAQRIAVADGAAIDANARRVLIGIGLLFAGEVEEAVPPLQEAMALGATSDDLDQIVLSARVASVFGEDATAADFCTRALRIARDRGAMGALPRILERLAFYEFRLGRYAAARVHACEGLGLARELGQETAVFECELAYVAAVQGRETECRDHARAARERAFERGSGLFAAMAAWAVGLLELARGRPEEAVAALEPALPGPNVLTHGIIALFLMPDYIEASARAGRVDAARAALGPYEQWAGAVGQPWALALAAHCRGLVATGEAAEKHFAEALRLHPQVLRPFEHARSELAYGEALRRSRKRGEARDHLRAALAAFEQLGAAPWEERARSELRATGESARRRDPSTLDELTPQELQIARLVAEGGSNKEIAAQLFLSPRTVEYHLRKIFAKLGISSRSELVRQGVEARRPAVA